ncbi:MAG: flippase-like domain-containing protein [Bacteroidetes bacterium]|nr:flippase-like domain-containing protein [Bacteroidota bacterium]
MKNKKLFIFKLLLSCLFFVLLLGFVRENELRLLLERVQWKYLVLSFLLIPIMLTTSCLKWKVLLDVNGKPVSFSALLRIYFVGYFFSNLLPSAVGGDVVRSFYSGRLIHNQAYAAVCVFLERFTGILFLLLLVMFAPLAKPELYMYPEIYIPVCGAFVLLFIIIWVGKVKNPLFLPNKITEVCITFLYALAERFSLPFFAKSVVSLEKISQRILQKLTRFHDELEKSIKVIKKEKLLFIKLFLLTAFFYLLTWVNVYVSFRAFGVEIPFLFVSSLTPTAMFVGHLPVTALGNLGFFESVFVYYYLLVQIPVSESLAMMLLLRVKMLLLGMLGLITYLSYKYKRKKELEALQEFVEKNETSKS